MQGTLLNNPHEVNQSPPPQSTTSLPLHAIIGPMSTSTTPPVKTVPAFSINLGLRDLGHFLAVFVTSFLVTWQQANFSLKESVLYSVLPGVATVAFRQLFPNLGTSATQVASEVKQGEALVAQVEGTVKTVQGALVAPPSITAPAPASVPSASAAV